MTRLASRTWPVALFLFVLAAGLRLLYVLWQQTQGGLGSGAEMERAAISLARDGRLGNIFAADSGPSAHIAPLYAGLLSVVYRLFGLPQEAGRLPQHVLAILATATGMALLPWLGKRLRLHPWTGLVAGLLLAVSPLNLWIECSGSWEQPVAALALLALLAVGTSLHDNRWQALPTILAGGSLLGLTALLCPSILPVAALFAAAELTCQRGQRRQVLKAAGIMAAVSGLWLAPWIWRNYAELGGWVALRSNFGLELWVGNNPWANGKTFGTHSEDPNHLLWHLHPFLNQDEQARLQTLGELAYMREKRQLALSWIADHPEQFAWLTLRRCRLYWLPPPDLWPPSTPLRELKAVLWSLTSLGAMLGLAWLLRRRHPYGAVLLAGIVGPALIYLVTHVDTRYRYPTFALSVLLACEGLLLLGQELAGRWSNRRLDQPLFRSTLTPRP